MQLLSLIAIPYPGFKKQLQHWQVANIFQFLIATQASEK
jgi:hypothetical protein